jgi:sugar/nucleoside kinase (ribokinase family)
MASRLGLSVGIIDRVGKDEFGLFYSETLSSEGIDVSNLYTSETQTAHCICLVDEKGDHAYISFMGATQCLEKEQVNPSIITDSRSLYISGYSLTTQPIRDATIKALQIACQNQLQIYFDPSPRVSTIPVNTLQYVMEKTNGLFLNTNEFNVLSNKMPSNENLFDYCDFIALKQAENGCTIYKEGEKYRFHGHIVDVKDTTGAGDVFNAAYIYGQLTGWEFHECATFANRLAAEKVKRLGAGLNVPSRQKALKILNTRSN